MRRVLPPTMRLCPSAEPIRLLVASRSEASIQRGFNPREGLKGTVKHRRTTLGAEPAGEHRYDGLSENADQ